MSKYMPDVIYAFEPCDFSSERTWFNKNHYNELEAHYGTKEKGTKYIRADLVETRAPLPTDKHLEEIIPGSITGYRIDK